MTRHVNRYDLHPVVRGVASGTLPTEDRDRFGQRAVDYFSQRPDNPYEQAETLDDVRNGLQLVQALLQMWRTEDAFNVCQGGLLMTLLFNLEAPAEVLSLVRPFFTRDWTAPAADLSDYSFAWLANEAALAFHKLGQYEQSLVLDEVALRMCLDQRNWSNMRASLAHTAVNFAEQNRLARYSKFIVLGLELAELIDGDVHLFRARLSRFKQLAEIGRWGDAEVIWHELDAMGRDWQRDIYRPGDAEEEYVRSQLRQGRLTEDVLAQAERVARSGRNRVSVRFLHALRGEWHLGRQEWALAVESLHEAVRMTRETGASDAWPEAWLALARFHLGLLPDARQEANRLSSRADPSHLPLAELWHAMEDTAQAAYHALAAYQWAWSDGEPFVHRYELTRATGLLKLLGTEIPQLPAYDPPNEPQLAFEDQVRAVIQELRAKRASRDEPRQD